MTNIQTISRRLFLLFYFPIYSLAQEPTAKFIWNPIPACVGLPVCFIDSSIAHSNTSIGYWSWSFSDGTLSTDQNPTHIFNDSGGYMVTLTVVDITGSIDDTTIWVEIDNCSTSCSANGLNDDKTLKRFFKVTDLLGRETKQTNQLLFYIYDDGSVEKRIIID